MSVYQQRYWNQLKEFKTHIVYLQKYAAHSEWWDKAINIFLAITSSSSIAAWAIWQEYQLLWAIIIAGSQIVTSIKPFLPYKHRLKAVSTLGEMMQDLCLECEKYWFQVAEGELTEKEIHDINIDLKDKSIAVEKKALKNIVLPTNRKILNKAEKEADKYFKINYSEGG